MIRKIIEIDESKCDGCGKCVRACAEGAIQIVNGKARLVSETYCDGLGACIGDCPRDAIRMVEREAPAFDEKAVAARLGHAPQPASVAPQTGCPGMRALWHEESAPASTTTEPTGAAPSALRQWPVQLHLLNPSAPYLKNCHLLIAADCTAFALGGFHQQLLQGRVLAIACPKLDDTAPYVEKLADIFAQNQVQSVTIAIMEVPCCGGLLRIVQKAIELSRAAVECKTVVVSLRGETTTA